jgi:hypothetical protein
VFEPVERGRSDRGPGGQGLQRNSQELQTVSQRSQSKPFLFEGQSYSTKLKQGLIFMKLTKIFWLDSL